MLFQFSFYEHKEQILKEMNAIFDAINRGATAYELQYDSEVELKGFLGIAKLKKDE